MANIVYIATSLDGYIADKEGGLNFLQTVPAPEGDDFGFAAFMDSIDALVMGRVTMETVLSFGGDWPYGKPVYVVSRTLREAPESLRGKVEIMCGSPQDIVRNLAEKGHSRLYIDGGKVIQGFLTEDMIDEMIIATIPLLLGGGTPLFGDIARHLVFELVNTEVLADGIPKAHYRRKR